MKVKKMMKKMMKRKKIINNNQYNFIKLELLFRYYSSLKYFAFSILITDLPEPQPVAAVFQFDSFIVLSSFDVVVAYTNNPSTIIGFIYDA